MPQTWLNALNTYEYPSHSKRNFSIPSDLFDLSGAFFLQASYAGNREATHSFENYFRDQASHNPIVWHEVALWKLYSQLNSPKRKMWDTIRTIRRAIHTETEANTLWNSVNKFLERSDRYAMQDCRRHLGLSWGMAVTLTFAAFAASHSHFPMLDAKVADWVNANMGSHNGTGARLIKFKSREWKHTYYIADIDFDAYLCWTAWCRETAKILSAKAPINDGWRARDVEMAVFTAELKRLQLNPL